MNACVYSRTTISTRRERSDSIRMESKLMMIHSCCFVVWFHILQAVKTIILGEYCRKRVTTKVTVHAALNAFVAKGRAARSANHIDDVQNIQNVSSNRSCPERRINAIHKYRHGMRNPEASLVAKRKLWNQLRWFRFPRRSHWNPLLNVRIRTRWERPILCGTSWHDLQTWRTLDPEALSSFIQKLVYCDMYSVQSVRSPLRLVFAVILLWGKT